MIQRQKNAREQQYREIWGERIRDVVKWQKYPRRLDGLTYKKRSLYKDEFLFSGSVLTTAVINACVLQSL